MRMAAKVALPLARATLAWKSLSFRTSAGWPSAARIRTRCCRISASWRASAGCAASAVSSCSMTRRASMSSRMASSRMSSTGTADALEQQWATGW
jgi:hypothetical protein